MIGEGGRTINAIRAHSGADVQVKSYPELGAASIPTMAILTVVSQSVTTTLLAGSTWPTR